MKGNDLSLERIDLRPLSAEERRVLHVLLEPAFPGRDSLMQQLHVAQVSEESRSGCPTIAFQVDPLKAPPAKVRQRIPVEALGIDVDGQEVHILLHVVDGYLNELEFFRYDHASVSPIAKLRSIQVSLVPFQTEVYTVTP